MTQPVKIHRLTSSQPDFQQRLDQLLRFDAAQDEAISKTVKDIVADIRAREIGRAHV
jgi:histidinol dehydrogenase